MIWDALKPAQPRSSDRDPAPWLAKLSAGTAYGKFIQPCADLDGDGMGDLVWSSRTTDTIVAFSGRDGSFLWSHQIGADGAVHPGPAAVGSAGSNPGTARRCIIQFLTPVPDADRDGIADLAATVIFYETDDEMQRRLPLRPAASIAFRWCAGC